MRPTQLVSVYLNEDNLSGGGSSPTPSTLTFENALTDASFESGGMFDVTPSTGCRMQAAGTITGKLGVFKLSGFLVTVGGGPSASVTWTSFLPPMAVVPSTHGLVLARIGQSSFSCFGEVVVAVDGSVTIANASTVIGAATYSFDCTISCQLA